MTTSNTIRTPKMFSSVKYFMTGDLKPSTVGLLEAGGARRHSYLSSLVTHCIVGTEPQYQEMGEAEEMLEVPVVTEEWVTSSARCGNLLPVRGFSFSTSSSQLFRGITMVMDMDSLAKEDCDKLWAMVTWYGGRVVRTVDEEGTHLVCGGWRNDLENLDVTAVTPAWVIASIKNSERVDENEYHPTLFWKASEGKNDSQPDENDSVFEKTGHNEDDLLDVTEQWEDTTSLIKDEEYYEDNLDETKMYDNGPCQVCKIREEEDASYENVSAMKEVDKYDLLNIVIKIEVDDAVPKLRVNSETTSLDPEAQNSSCSSYNSAFSMLSQESDIISTSEYFSQSSREESTEETNKIMTNNNEVKVDGIHPLGILRPKRSSSMNVKDPNLKYQGMKTSSSQEVLISKSTSLPLKVKTEGPMKPIKERKRKFSGERSSSFPFNKCSLGTVENPVKRIKVEQSIPSPVNPVSRRWSESDKFRKGYSRAEVMALINFFKEQGLYYMKSGTQVWKIIEKASICPGRSWQSLKSFFLKYIVNQLPSFGVTEKELDDQARRINDMGRWRFGEGSSRDVEIVASFYTMAEDKKILNYIIDLGRVEEAGLSLGGNRFWKMLEKKSVVVGRSWQSMKERFRKKIVKNLNDYDLSDSDMDIIRQLL